jgi:ubiquinone/menaquinone biosynthesis C-methylase UbiE
MDSVLSKLVLEFGFLPGEHVADFGSGSGHLTLPLSRVLGPDGRLYAIDLHKEGLNRLQNMAEDQGLSNLHVICGDIENHQGTGLQDGVVGGVVFSNIVFELSDLVAAILEAKRILMMNGKLVLVEETEKIPKLEIRKNFEKNGLELDRRVESDKGRTILIFRKR